MDIFISWSGEMSRELGQVLRDWLPLVLQSARPFFAPNIDKGARWGARPTEARPTCPQL